MIDDARTANRLRAGLDLASRVAHTFADAPDDYAAQLAAIVRTIAVAIPDLCTITVLGEDGTITPVAFYDPDPEVVARFDVALMRPRSAREAPLAAAALAVGQQFLPQVDLAELRTRAPAEVVDRLESIGTRGLIVVPLVARGERHGTLTLIRHRPEHPPLDAVDLEILTNIASHAALAIASSRLFARLQHSEQLRVAEERAVQASTLLDAIVENIPDMVFVKDADRLAFVRFNRAGEHLLGLSRDQLLGKTDRDLFPPDEADFFIAKDRETLAANGIIEILEEPIQTPSGTRWLHTKKVALAGRDGAAGYLLGISRDITAPKLALAELRDAKDAAERASHELEAFSYSVAHDLRAPLRAIEGFSHLIQVDHGAGLDADGHALFTRIREAAQRMAGLIDDLLALSRVTRGSLQRERVDLSSVAADVIDELRRAHPERAVEIAIAPGLIAEADRRMLHVAFTNLFGNAWKFTGKRAHPHVELGVTEIGGDRAFFVRDNGAGFDMKHVGKLFGVFQRLHGATEFPGTGIGLVTVARIVERHRGRVWAEGEPDRGATFYFTLEEHHA